MTKGNPGNRFSTEVRARAVCLVLENEANYKSRSQAVAPIAEKFGCSSATLREWVNKQAIEDGDRDGLTRSEREGVTLHFGGVRPNAAEELTLRHDHGSNYRSEDFQNEINCFGMVSSLAFVRQPEGNGVAERAVRTLKEQLLWVRHFETIKELCTALAEFAAQYNASWLHQRHGYKTPDQIRAEQKGLEADAAKAIMMAA